MRNTVRRDRSLGLSIVVCSEYERRFVVLRLNESESMELVGPVVAQGRKEFIEKWLSEDKLTCTEQLGDMVKPLDTKLALSVFLRAQCHDKVIACFVAAGEYEKVVQYVKRVNYANADYGGMLRTIVATNPEGAVKFAKGLLDNNPPLIDINKVVRRSVCR